MRSNVVFVLVRPVYLGNIGAAARVLKNFGFSNLRFVQPPKGYKDAEARKMSVGAFDVLKYSKVFETLEDALKDVSVAVGTTSGKQRGFEPRSLPDVRDAVVSAAQANTVAFVFGDEVNGLSKAELERCHHIITIPADPEFPALNLAQAIAICAWEMARPNNAEREQPELSTGQGDDELFTQLDLLLDRIEFTKSFNRTNVLTELRQFYQRAHPTARERDLLAGAIRKIAIKLSATADQCSQ